MKLTLLFGILAVLGCCLAACAFGPPYNDHYYGYDRDYYYDYPYYGYGSGYYGYGPHGYGRHGSPYVYRYYERRERDRGLGPYEEREEHERVGHRGEL